MSIYDYSGQQLNAAYDADGTSINIAYDYEGNVVFNAGFPLKILQYNVGQWYIGDHDNVPSDKDAAYYALQSGIISQNDADILLLEEYTAQFSKAGRATLSMLFPSYPYFHEETNGTTTTVTQRAIYSKYPISNYTAHKFSDSNYYYDTCTITINGIEILVAVTHLHWNNRTYRAQEVQTILSGVSGSQYVIIGGDFNTTDCFSTSGLDYIAVVKPFLDAGYRAANAGDFGFIGTYTSGSSAPYTMTVLDNIVVSSNITFKSVQADQTKLTDGLNEKVDHLPLIATLQIGGTS